MDRPCNTSYLFVGRSLARGQRQAGSLAGVAPSERISEGPKGGLSIVGNYALSVEAKARLTVVPPKRTADAKAGLSDPTCSFSRSRV